MPEKIDYSNYSLPDLYQARACVDRARFPENAAEIDRRISLLENQQNEPVLEVIDTSNMDLATLYKAGRSAQEEEGDPQKARQLFQKVIEGYPDTDEAKYAAGFINDINATQRQDNDDTLNQQDMKLEFSGSAKDYFRVWIVNLCLTLLTVSIFSAWAKVRKKRYIYSHLTLDGTPFQYLAQPIPILKGRVIAAVLFLLYYLSSNLFTALYPYVLGAGLVIAPWVIVQSVAFNARYSAYRNMTFRFEGTYWEALKVISAWGLIPAFIIGTMFSWWEKYWIAGILGGLFGILFPWWMQRLKNFIITNTSYGGQCGQFGATGGQFFRIYFLSGLILFGFGIAAGIFVAVAGLLKNNTAYAPFVVMIPIYAGYVLAFAYVQANMTNTVWNQARLGPVHFRSTLTTFDLAKLYLANAIGIIASAGLLIPWAEIRTIRYRADHTQVIRRDELTEFQGNEDETVQAAGAELSEFFDLDLSL